MSHLVHRCEVLGLRPQAQVIQRGGERFQPAGLMPCSAYGIHSPAGLLHEVGGAKLWENLTFPHVNKNTSPKVNKKKWKQIVHAVSWPKFDCRLSVTWCVDTHQLPGFCLSSRKQITLEYLKSNPKAKEDWRLKRPHAAFKPKVWPAQRCGVWPPQEGGVGLQGARWGVQVSAVNGFLSVSYCERTQGVTETVS